MTATDNSAIPARPLSRKKSSRKWLGILSRGPLRLAGVAFNAALVLSSLTLFGWLYTLPDPISAYPLEKTVQAPTSRELVLKTASGDVYARRGGCYGGPVSLSSVPKHVVDALLAMEDRRFYSHFGVDPIGIARAARANYRAGHIVQGGSTITQQLAKNTYLSNVRSFDRKLEEAIVVLRLELALTKNQILERYLSRAYFGEGCFGLPAAARHYFGTTVEKLTVEQSAQIVALLKSPGTLTRSPEQLRSRTNLVLDAMVANGALTAAKRAELTPPERVQTDHASLGNHYADWVAETVDPGPTASLAPLPVTTAFDPGLQKAAEETVAKYLSTMGERSKAGQAAMVVMRPDGRVLAMVGGADYGESQFNRATQALRQPGSSFKAFVYLAAMRAGGRPDMQAVDQPIMIGSWAPENYSHSYRGPVSLQQAFLSSINTVAVQVSEAVGRNEVVRAAADLGITSQLHAEPSIALGTSEVTLLELTSAYAAFAADAYPVKPWGVLGTGNSDITHAAPPDEAGRWRLSQGPVMRQILSATVQYGTGRAARLPIPAYGKTGTSQDYRDAWFIGFAGNLVVGVWVGNDDNSPMARVTGGSMPATIWQQFMVRAMKVDKEFSRRLPQVAAFKDAVEKPARAPSTGLHALMADARTHMARTEMVVDTLESGAIFGEGEYTRPMMLGRSGGGWGPGQPQARPRRALDGWVHRTDGS